MIDNQFVKPWEYKNKYLITLCDKCHEKAHKNKIKTIHLDSAKVQL